MTRGPAPGGGPFAPAPISADGDDGPARPFYGTRDRAAASFHGSQERVQDAESPINRRFRHVNVERALKRGMEQAALVWLPAAQRSSGAFDQGVRVGEFGR